MRRVAARRLICWILRPLRPIVCSGPKADIFSHITKDPANAKTTVKYGNKYTPSQKKCARPSTRAPTATTRQKVLPPAPRPPATMNQVPTAGVSSAFSASRRMPGEAGDRAGDVSTLQRTAHSGHALENPSINKHTKKL